MRRVPVLMVAGWLAAAVAATAAGAAGVMLIGDGLDGPGGDVVSADEIDRQLAAEASGRPTGAGSGTATARAGEPASASPGRPSPTGPPSTAPAGSRRVFSEEAATVVAQCDGEVAELLSWTPANGYLVHEVDHRRGVEAEVSFERGGERVKFKITCSAGTPVLRLDD